MNKRLLIRTLVLLGLAVCVLGVFSVRLMKLQIVHGKDYLEQASTSITVTSSISAARGEIVDRYGRVMAGNRVGYTISLNRLYLPDDDLNETLVKLVQLLQAAGEDWSSTLPLSQQEPWTFAGDETAVARLKATLKLSDAATAQNVWSQMLRRYGLEDYDTITARILCGIRYEMELHEYSNVTPFTLATDVSMKTVAAIRERSQELRGVEILEESVRYYADGSLMPHILGSVGPIYKEEYEALKGTYSMNAVIGKSGLEKAFENVLRGTDGTVQTLRSANGAILSTTVVEEPIPGDTLVLTVDSYLQAQLNHSLENLVQTISGYAQSGSSKSQKELGDAKGAAAVVIDCKTGGILASATYPSYDLNLYSSQYYNYLSDELNPLFNRAFNGTYRPGSTFKTCTGLTGLLEGIIDENSTVYCNGVYTYYAPTYTPGCLMHGHGRGPINIVNALKASCNSFFYDVGRRCGYAAINRTASTLGLGVSTGVEIGEAVGSLSSPEYRRSQIEAGLNVEDWQEGDILQAAIGQMDTFLTPVQLATWAASLANHGIRYKTHLVGATTTYDYSEINEIEPEILGQITDADAAFEAVEKGMIAASTQGSSSVYLADYPYTIATKTGTPQVTASVTNGTIIAYGPTEEPEIAVAVVVENCANGYWLTQTVVDVFDAYYFSKNGSLSAVPENTLLG